MTRCFDRDCKHHTNCQRYITFEEIRDMKPLKPATFGRSPRGRDGCEFHLPVGEPAKPLTSSSWPIDPEVG